MNVLGFRASAAFGSEPDVKAWTDRVALNAARVPPDHPRSPALDPVQERLAAAVPPGVARLEELSAGRPCRQGPTAGVRGREAPAEASSDLLVRGGAGLL